MKSLKLAKFLNKKTSLIWKTAVSVAALTCMLENKAQAGFIEYKDGMFELWGNSDIILDETGPYGGDYHSYYDGDDGAVGDPGDNGEDGGIVDGDDDGVDDDGDTPSSADYGHGGAGGAGSADGSFGGSGGAGATVGVQIESTSTGINNNVTFNNTTFTAGDGGAGGVGYQGSTTAGGNGGDGGGGGDVLVDLETHEDTDSSNIVSFFDAGAGFPTLTAGSGGVGGVAGIGVGSDNNGGNGGNGGHGGSIDILTGNASDAIYLTKGSLTAGNGGAGGAGGAGDGAGDGGDGGDGGNGGDVTVDAGTGNDIIILKSMNITAGAAGTGGTAGSGGATGTAGAAGNAGNEGAAQILGGDGDDHIAVSVSGWTLKNGDGTDGLIDGGAGSDDVFVLIGTSGGLFWDGGDFSTSNIQNFEHLQIGFNSEGETSQVDLYSSYMTDIGVAGDLIVDTGSTLDMQLNNSVISNTIDNLGTLNITGNGAFDNLTLDNAVNNTGQGANLDISSLDILTVNNTLTNGASGDYTADPLDPTLYSTASITADTQISLGSVLDNYGVITLDAPSIVSTNAINNYEGEMYLKSDSSTEDVVIDANGFNNSAYLELGAGDEVQVLGGFTNDGGTIKGGDASSALRLGAIAGPGSSFTNSGSGVIDIAKIIMTNGDFTNNVGANLKFEQATEIDIQNSTKQFENLGDIELADTANLTINAQTITNQGSITTDSAFSADVIASLADFTQGASSGSVFDFDNLTVENFINNDSGDLTINRDFNVTITGGAADDLFTNNESLLLADGVSFTVEGDFTNTSNGTFYNDSGVASIFTVTGDYINSADSTSGDVYLSVNNLDIDGNFANNNAALSEFDALENVNIAGTVTNEAGSEFYLTYSDGNYSYISDNITNTGTDSYFSTLFGDGNNTFTTNNVTNVSSAEFEILDADNISINGDFVNDSGILTIRNDSYNRGDLNIAGMFDIDNSTSVDLVVSNLDIKGIGNNLDVANSTVDFDVDTDINISNQFISNTSTVNVIGSDNLTVSNGVDIANSTVNFDVDTDINISNQFISNTSTVNVIGSDNLTVSNGVDFDDSNVTVSTQNFTVSAGGFDNYSNIADSVVTINDLDQVAITGNLNNTTAGVNSSDVAFTYDALAVNRTFDVSGFVNSEGDFDISNASLFEVGSAAVDYFLNEGGNTTDHSTIDTEKFVINGDLQNSSTGYLEFTNVSSSGAGNENAVTGEILNNGLLLLNYSDIADPSTAIAQGDLNVEDLTNYITMAGGGMALGLNNLNVSNQLYNAQGDLILDVGTLKVDNNFYNGSAATNGSIAVKLDNLQVGTSSSAGTFINYAGSSIDIDDNISTKIFGDLDNYGSVILNMDTVSGGVLEVGSVSDTIAGDLLNNTGADIAINDLNSATINGELINSGTNVDINMTGAGDFDVISYVRNSGNSIDISNASDLTVGGYLQNDDTDTTAGTNIINLSAGGVLTVSEYFLNHDTATISADSFDVGEYFENNISANISTSGDLSVGDYVLNNGTMDIVSGANINITGTNLVNTTNAFENNGTVNLDTATLTLSAGDLDNNSTFNIDSINTNITAGNIINDGTIALAAGDKDITFTGDFTNNGALTNFNSGVIGSNITFNGNYTNNYTTGAISFADLDNLIVTGDVSLASGTTNNISSDNVTVANIVNNGITSITSNNDFDLTGTSISNSGTLTFSNDFTDNSAVVTNTGILNINSYIDGAVVAELNNNSGGTVNLYRDLTAMTSITNGGDFINNNADLDIIVNGGTGVFNNNGAFTNNVAGATDITIDGDFSNSATGSFNIDGADNTFEITNDFSNANAVSLNLKRLIVGGNIDTTDDMDITANFLEADNFDVNDTDTTLNVQLIDMDTGNLNNDAGGHLTLAKDNMNVIGNVLNYGEMSIGTNSIFIDGNFDNDTSGGEGLLNLTLDNTASKFGKITTSNSLDLANSTIDVTVNGAVSVGDSYLIMNSVSDNLAVSGLTINNTAVVTYDFDTDVNNGKLYLKIANLASYEDIAETEATTGDINSENAIVIGGILDEIQQDVGAKAEIQTLYDVLQNLSTNEEVNNNLFAIMPQTNHLALVAADDHQMIFFDAIDKELSEKSLNFETLKGIKKTNNAWVKGIVGMNSYDSREEFYGNDTNMNGVAGGYDKVMPHKDNTIRGGVAFSFISSDTDSDTADEDFDYNLKTSSIGLAAYAGYQKGRVYINAALGLGLNNYDQDREAIDGGFLKSDFSGSNYSARVSAVMKSNFLEPFAFAHFSNLKIDGYTEEGTSSSAMVVEGNSANELKIGLGGRARLPLAMGSFRFDGELGARYVYDVLNEGLTTNLEFAKLENDGYDFEVKEPSLDPSSIIVDGRIKLKYKEGIKFGASYEMEIRDDFVGHKVMLEGGVLF